MSHTPAPWRVSYDAPMDLLNIVSTNGVVATMDPHNYRLAPMTEHQANALLIAAAPDMLVALKLADEIIHMEFCSSKLHHPACEAVSAAIEKAEGKP